MGKFKIADVILPIPIRDVFSYRIPALYEASITPGMRVVVPLGKRKKQSGLVLNVREVSDSPMALKEIEYTLDDKAILGETALKFWTWMADYYACSLGDVYKAALPAGLKLESETRLKLNSDLELSDALRGRERDVYELLFDNGNMSIHELEKALHVNYLIPVINRLEEKQVVMVEENIKRGFRKKRQTVLSLSAQYFSETELSDLFDRLNRAPKQLAALVLFLQLAEDGDGCYTKKIARQKLLLKGVATHHIKSLVEKGVFIEEQQALSRIPQNKSVVGGLKELSPFQQKALGEIQQSFLKKQVVFLHGVTSSGKTELYSHLAMECIKQNKQVLYLVPEIALSAQLTHRLQQYFGNQLAVYHSRLSGNERVEIYKSVSKENGLKLIVGPRSAQFLPFCNLALVIVDEEHEDSYKQDQPNPRYHGRDSAIMLGVMHQAKVLLGSATPSLETFYNSQVGKYAYVELKQRFGELPLPKINVVDLADAYKKRKMRGHFSFDLLGAMKETLAKDQQVILFLNRRGYAPFIECKSCSWVLKCPDCDVSLTKHKFKDEMRCHYCGFSTPVPTCCGSCGNEVMIEKGIGTEQVEEEVKTHLPKARVARMDYDTTRGKGGFEQLITSFENKEIDILIGTQMVGKGLDFDDVGLVGLVSADAMLHFSDFRASERSFQMIQQVAGRSGRKGTQGNVIIQTFQADHPVIRKLVSGAIESFYETEMEERKLFNYPPYSHLIVVSLRHMFRENVHDAAVLFAKRLRAELNGGVLGPEPPPVGRVKNQFIERIIIKVDKKRSQDLVKQTILAESESIKKSDKRFSSVMFGIDVDPV